MQALKIFLDTKINEYNSVDFIAKDPICIPHQFTKLQDIEIAGLFAATFAWGNRTSIINSSKRLMTLMDNSPHQFVLYHTDADLKKMLHFVHRTFNATDLYAFIHLLHYHYSRNSSLETAFLKGHQAQAVNVEGALNGFYDYFFSLQDMPIRTKKHVAAPCKHSTCKRLNMYLRWMVRPNNTGVDFGLWKSIKPHQLIIPMDVHVTNVAYRVGLLPNAKSNWNNAVLLTNKLKEFDNEDPVKYDFALFALGVIEKFR